MDKFEEAFLAGFEDGLEKVAKKGASSLWQKIKGGTGRYGQLMAGGKEMGAKGRVGNVPHKWGKMGKKQKVEAAKSMAARGGTGLAALLAAGGTAAAVSGKDKKKD